MSPVHLRQWPGDPARPALAIHCMMGSSRAFDPVAARLGERVALHGFDLPSHGRSAKWRPEAGEDYHSTVTRIARGLIRDIAGDGPLDLIGHSIGATVVLRIAVDTPALVRSLTLIEPVLFAASPRGHPLDGQLAELAAGGRMEQATRLFMDMWGGPGGFDALPAATRQAAIAQMPLILETGPAMSGDCHHILRPGGLEGILAPVMLIAGADSPPVIAEIAETLAARLADVGRASVPGAGHMLPMTHPEQVAGLIAVNLDRS